MSFKETKEQIVILASAEYRYDRLVSDFAEHYLALVDAGYKILPNIEELRSWLKHLHFHIRPNLLDAWKNMAAHYGFNLGDGITVEGTKLYAVRVSCYPLEEIVRFTGFGSRKDGKPSQSSVTISVNEHSIVQKLGHNLSQEELQPLFFEGTTRLPQIKLFLQEQLAQFS